MKATIPLMLRRTILCLSLFTVTAHADDATAEARAKMAEGYAAAKRGDFGAAVVAYRAVYAVKQNAEVLQNLGVTEVYAGQFVEGARHLTKLLASGGAISDQKFVEEMLAKAEREVGRLDITVDVAGAEVSIDEESVGRSPLKTTWHVAPGEHRVQARLDGYVTATRSVSASAGKGVAVKLELVRDAGSRAPPSGTGGASGAGAATPDDGGEKPSNNTRTVVLVSGAALTVVSAAVAVGFMVKANGHQSDADGLRTDARSQFKSDSGCSTVGKGGDICRELHSTLDDRDSANLYEGIGWGLAGTFAAATLVTYLLWSPERGNERPAASRWILAPAFEQHGARAVLGTTF